ncbi:hypothetical protein JTE90_013247 [Oedothorax gibbosus]|uniref:Uncharacterized protein n=1 Tax=Oedothorax gibbosus TaxID=931172 RepID=A0AAV6VCX3_9ARAC|nr:hypothetical protein JTE90_013247 [Oedothorax gibbosus]
MNTRGEASGPDPRISQCLTALHVPKAPSCLHSSAVFGAGVAIEPRSVVPENNFFWRAPPVGRPGTSAVKNRAITDALLNEKQNKTETT